MNRSKDRVCVLAGTSIVRKVRDDVAGAAPVTLQEASNLRSLRVAVTASLAQLRSQRTSFDQGTMLNSSGEE